jgi:hypothetical protein
LASGRVGFNLSSLPARVHAGTKYTGINFAQQTELLDRVVFGNLDNEFS